MKDENIDMKNKAFKRIAVLLIVAAVFAVIFTAVSFPTFAESDGASQPDAAAEEINSDTGAKALASGIAVGIACIAGAIGMAIAIGKSVESMARQPEASDKINSALMLGLVFIETTIIYALIVAILIVFVL